MKRYNKLCDAMMEDPDGQWLKWEDVAGQALQMMRKDDRIAALEAEVADVREDRLKCQQNRATNLETIKRLDADLFDARQAVIKEGLARTRAEERIKAHNDDCQTRCGIGEQEGVECGYRRYFPRRCPTCPMHEVIGVTK